MTLHVFLLLLLFVLMFSLVRLCSFCWPHHGPAQSAAAKRATIHRLLKPRSPHDCPICRLSCAHSSVVGRCSHETWWIIQVPSAHPLWDGDFISGESRQAISPFSEAPSDFVCWHLHQLRCDLTLPRQLASVALKQEPVARGKRAPHWPSIVASFCQRPWQGYGADSVAPGACPLVLAAARASLAALREDAQNGNTHATTPDGRAGAGTAVPSPRSGEPVRPPHGAPSDSPAR
jgi:hypothetical protein